MSETRLGGPCRTCGLPQFRRSAGCTRTRAECPYGINAEPTYPKPPAPPASPAMAEVRDPFADIRDKRIGELNGEQTDRAFELWLRENYMSFGRYYAEGDSALFPCIFRVIDRLRADAADIADQLAEISESEAILRLSNRYRPAVQWRLRGMIKRLRHG